MAEFNAKACDHLAEMIDPARIGDLKQVKEHMRQKYFETDAKDSYHQRYQQQHSGNDQGWEEAYAKYLQNPEVKRQLDTDFESYWVRSFQRSLAGREELLKQCKDHGLVKPDLTIPNRAPLTGGQERQ